MWYKIIGIVSMSLLFISFGVVWYRKSLSSKVRYDFKEDFKHTFLAPHWRYSNHFNFSSDRPLKIVPVLLIIGGIVVLIVGLIKVL